MKAAIEVEQDPKAPQYWLVLVNWQNRPTEQVMLVLSLEEAVDLRDQLMERLGRSTLTPGHLRD